MSTFTLELQLPEALRELGFGDEEICREVPVLLESFQISRIG